MSPRPGRGRAAWLAFASGVACVATGCVTTYETVGFDAPTRETLAAPPSVTIPFGDGGSADNEFVRFYQRVFERMQEAADDRDVPQLDVLLASYDRADLPPSIRDRVTGYRAIANGLRFVNAASASASLTVVPVPATGLAPTLLGEPMAFELRIPPPSTACELGGEDDDDPFALAFAFVVTDRFVDGNSEECKERHLVRLPSAFAWQGGKDLVVPFAVDVPPRPGVQRVVRVRVDTVPCTVRTEQGSVPIPPTTLARASLELWPKGHDVVRKAPLEHLRKALAAFDARNFACAYLAAWFAPASERTAVIDLLIEQVRFGRDDQAQVAMAALKVVTGSDLPIGDRDAWLAWWQARR